MPSLFLEFNLVHQHDTVDTVQHSGSPSPALEVSHHFCPCSLCSLLPPPLPWDWFCNIASSPSSHILAQDLQFTLLHLFALHSGGALCAKFSNLVFTSSCLLLGDSCPVIILQHHRLWSSILLSRFFRVLMASLISEYHWVMIFSWAQFSVGNFYI